MLTRRNLLTLPTLAAFATASGRIACVIAATLAAHPVLAEDWPDRPMTLVAPFGAGGSTDAIAHRRGRLEHPAPSARDRGKRRRRRRHEGANRVAKAAPDGYQFVLGNVGTHAQNQTLYKAPLYNAVTDFAPVVLMMDQSLVLVARNDFPANNLQEFIAYAKANQSKMQYSSSGAGGSNHLGLRAAQCGDRHQCHAYSLSQRRPGDAGPIGRPGRLPVPERAERRCRRSPAIP